MKNIAIFVLSALLVATSVFLYSIYGDNQDYERKLRKANMELSDNKIKNTELESEASKMRYQLLRSERERKELGELRQVVAQQKKDLDSKAKEAQDLRNKINKLESDLKEAKARVSTQSVASDVVSKNRTMDVAKVTVKKDGSPPKETASEDAGKKIASVAAERKGNQTQAKVQVQVQASAPPDKAPMSTPQDKTQASAAQEKPQASVPQEKPQVAETQPKKQEEPDKSSVDCREWIEKNQEMVRSNKELEQQLNENQTRLTEMEKNVASLIKQKADLDRQLELTVNKKKKMEEEMAQLRSASDSMVSELQQEIEQKEVTIQSFRRRISVSVVDSVLFGFGSFTISPEGQGILKKVGQALKGVKDKEIRIVGHTDDIPFKAQAIYRNWTNWELSARRAVAVTRFLQDECELDPSHMEAVGRSFHDPRVPNDSDDNRAQNRRVEIVVSPVEVQGHEKGDDGGVTN